MSEKSEAPSGIDRKASGADHTQMGALTQSLSDRNGRLAIQPRRIWPPIRRLNGNASPLTMVANLQRPWLRVGYLPGKEVRH